MFWCAVNDGSYNLSSHQLPTVISEVVYYDMHVYSLAARSCLSGVEMERCYFCERKIRATTVSDYADSLWLVILSTLHTIHA